jgi:metallo-beta-lactamase family protein
VPVYLNSPMATNATNIYASHRNEHRLSVEECRAMCNAAVVAKTVDESKALNRLKTPAIIVSASGMATGGRVLHHLKAFAPDARNLILFTGFQSAGTRGAALVAGTDTVKIHGEWIPVRAEVAQLHTLSAHADRDQLVAWLKSAASPPRRVFVTHGEPAASDTLRQFIRRELPVDVTVPEHGESVTLELPGGSPAVPRAQAVR